MPHRQVAVEQLALLKIMLLGAFSSAVGAVPMAVLIDPFSAAPVDVNTTIALLVSGSLGGAFISASRKSRRKTQPHRCPTCGAILDFAEWRNRITTGIIVGICLTPLIIMLLKLTANAATILGISFVVSFCAKEALKIAEERVLGPLRAKKQACDTEDRSGE